MATLKQHQAAMVDLLANGSGIPASASRLAHAMHDVLATILAERIYGKPQRLAEQLIADESNYGVNNLLLKVGATTPGLNDRALAEDIKAVRPKQVSAEQRVKQLRETNSRLRRELQCCRVATELADDTTAHSPGAVKLPEQSGVRKEDTQAMCNCGCPYSHYDESRELQICNGCRGVK